MCSPGPPRPHPRAERLERLSRFTLPVLFLDPPTVLSNHFPRDNRPRLRAPLHRLTLQFDILPIAHYRCNYC